MFGILGLHSTIPPAPLSWVSFLLHFNVIVKTISSSSLVYWLHRTNNSRLIKSTRKNHHSRSHHPLGTLRLALFIHNFNKGLLCFHFASRRLDTFPDFTCNFQPKRFSSCDTELWPRFIFILDGTKTNHRGEYLGRRSPKVIVGSRRASTHARTQRSDRRRRLRSRLANHRVETDRYKTARLQSVIYLSGFPGTKAVKPETVPDGRP